MFPVQAKWLLGTVFCITIAILSLIWTPYRLLLEERLRMRPGLPPFDWWYQPPNATFMQMYFFNITNADRFLEGKDPKMNMVEVGPIPFKEVLTHSDVVFNENGTMSYTLRTNFVYDDTLDTIDLNSTLYVPNIPALIALSTFWDYNYFLKKMVNFLLVKTKSKPIVKKTIYEMMYNNTDSFVRLTHAVLPNIAVVDNVAVLPMISNGYSNRITVYIGNKFGHQNFFLINRYNGSMYIPSNDGTCKDKIVGAAHGIIFNQLIEKTQKIRYFYNGACGMYETSYKDEVYRQEMKAYRFVMGKDAYNRTYPLENDCYKGNPTLLNGLKDVSLCWHSFPVVRSYPHFLHGDPKLLSYVNGMRPNATRHTGYAIIEPMTGISLESRAFLQVNIHIRPWTGFDKAFEKFNDMILPVFYFELGHNHVPTYVATFMRFGLMLPTIGNVISAVLFILGFYCIWHLLKEIRKKNVLQGRRKSNCLHTLETESFINTARTDIKL